MYLARFFNKQYERESYGSVARGTVRELLPLLQGDFRASGHSVALGDARLLAPVHPHTVVCTRRNFSAHIAEIGAQPAAAPDVLIKRTSRAQGPDSVVTYPADKVQLLHEVELGVVIGRPAARLSPEVALSHVWGYVAAADLPTKVVAGALVEGVDVPTVIGPWLATDIEPDDLLLELRVNGQVRQSARTSEMLFSVAQVVSAASHLVPLGRGDLILCGSPGGVAPLAPGDVVDISVEEVGSFRFSVQAE